MVNPDLSVVIASRGRPLRLRWLLNALERQTLLADRWEVVVAHAGGHPAVDSLLAGHPLAEAGQLRPVRLPAAATPGGLRNAAARAARAPTLVFTHDDCRPPEDWLEQLAAAVGEHPDAVIEGPVAPDPTEDVRRLGAYPHTLSVPAVPSLAASAANIAYPRALFERLGGFADAVERGSDTDLALRAEADGAVRVGAEEAETFHTVRESWLPARIREALSCRDDAWLVSRHPELRDTLPLRVFRSRSHALLWLGILGIVASRRRPLVAALALPWAVNFDDPDRSARGRRRQLAELPGWAAIELAEASSLVAGSFRHRTIVL
jgi:glycosyltransferase involved in cell wall biosynthesis